MSAIIYALSANAGIAASKAAAAIYTGSSSMLAEAVHSAADCTNQLLLLLGIKQSKREPTPNHPLGYGKASYFWSFMVALMLFSLGGAFSIYEGIHKLGSSEPIENPLIAIGVLAFGFILEAASLKGCVNEIREKSGDMPLWRYFKESRESELIVVMGEDIAALLGLAFALTAITLSVVTGNPIYDAFGSIVVGLLLVVVAVGVGMQVQSLLIGESASPETEQSMNEWLKKHELVAEVYNVITFQMGDYLFAAIKARMEDFETVAEHINAINLVQDQFKIQFPQTRWVFFEPDDKRNTETAKRVAYHEIHGTTPNDLRSMRGYFGLTQTQLAIFLGVVQRTIEHWEAGLTEPPEGTLKRLQELSQRLQGMTPAS